jgi:hypothetical protein
VSTFVPLLDTEQVQRSREWSCLAEELDRGRGYRRCIPRVSAFYGIVIYMYWNEQDHLVARYLGGVVASADSSFAKRLLPAAV